MRSRSHAGMGRYLFALMLFGATPLLAQPPAKAPEKVVEKAPEKSSPAAVRQYRDAVAFQNRNVYDLASDEWEKFLEKFPTDPLAAKAQHYLGVCRLQLKQYDKALAAFQKVVDGYPKFEMLDVTLLNLGLTQYSLAQAGKGEMFAAAAGSFASLVKKFPESKQAAQALYYQGESLYSSGKKDEAAQAYAQLVEKYPDSPQRAEAVYALGVAREETGKAAEAAAAYDLFLKEFTKHTLRAEVIMRRAETLFASKQYADAAQWFASAAAAKDFPLADQAAMRQAASLYEQKKYLEAAELYASISTKFPESKQIPAATLAAGNCYYLAGDLKQAETWLGKVLGAGGETAAEAGHWLARAALKQKQAAKALEIVEKVLPASAKSPLAVNLQMDQADAIFEIDARRSEAAPLYAAIAEKNPKHELAAQALYMAGFASLGQGSYQAARDYAESFLKAYANDPLSAEVKYVEAEANLLLGKYAEAEQLYEDLLAKHGGHADAEQWKVRRALALFLEKKYQDVADALKPLVLALRQPDQLAEAQYLLGSSQYELKDYDAAVKALEASLAAAPKRRQGDETLLNLAAAYRQQNKLDLARSAVNRVLAEFPNSKLLDRAHYRLGEYAYAAGDLSAAAEEYQLVLEKWSGGVLAPHAMYGLGWAELGQKNYEAAAKTFSAMIDKNPEHTLTPRARYGRAMARQQLKEYAGAIEDVQAFLKTNPGGAELTDAQYVQALSLDGLKKYGEAVEVYRAILKNNPKYANADKVLYNLAWALKSEQHHDKAAEVFEQLAKDYPESSFAAEAQYHLGDSYYEAKDFSKAAKAYYASQQKAGKSELGEKAEHKLAWSNYQLEKFSDAQQWFDHQAAGYPQGELTADALFMAGESLFKQNKYAPALASYQKSLQKLPANKDFQVLVLLHAGQSAGQLKKWDEASKWLERAAKEFPDSPYAAEILYEQGWAKQNLDKPSDALKLYEQAADLSEREAGARARFMMGEILFEQKQYTEAVRNFFKVAYGFGHPDAPEPVRKWQANSVYEAGRCFEVLQKPDQAKKAYQEVLDKYPNSDKAPLAKARMAALGAG